MRSPLSLPALLACLPTLLLGAPSAAAEPDCLDSFEDVLASPRRIFQRAGDAYQDGDFASAYQLASLIHRFHPESDLSRDAFLLATRAFRPVYRFKRVDARDSPWAQAEPYLIFQWATTFFEGDAFPQEEIDSMLRKMPKVYARAWTGFVERLYGKDGAARWKFEIRYDNGLVDTVTGQLARPATQPANAG